MQRREGWAQRINCVLKVRAAGIEEDLAPNELIHRDLWARAIS